MIVPVKVVLNRTVVVDSASRLTTCAVFEGLNGRGGTNVSCQLKFWPFVSRHLNDYY